MYNTKRKEAFLKFKRETTELAGNLQLCFKDAEHFEKQYGKDLCDWTAAEIIGYFKYMNTPKIKSLTTIHNMLRIYTDWCLSNQLVLDNQNHYYEITQDILIECIDKDKLKEKYITREFLLDKMKLFLNESDKFIVLAAFEGMTSIEMSKVRIKDFEGNLCHLPRRTIPVSDELAQIAANAAAETSYSSYKTRNTVFLKEAEEIIRPANNRYSHNEPTGSIIATRYYMISKHMDLDMSLVDIKESGRMDYIRKYMKENNVTLHEMLSPSHREEMEHIYGKIQSQATYEKIYGEIIAGT